MAKEFTGIILLLLLVCLSDKGKQILGKVQRKKGESEKPFSEQRLKDWILLLETLLEWEQWMKSDRMNKVQVWHSRQKHRYIMYLIKKIARRKLGMGHKIVKYHAIMHIADDILNFGIPMEVDTGSNEMGHKPTKTAAKLTQRNKETFDIQTAKRLEEVDLLDIAMEEFAGRAIWDYRQGYGNDDEIPEKEPKLPSIGGAKFDCFVDEDGELTCNSFPKIRGKYPDFVMEESLIRFVAELSQAVSAYIDNVFLQSKHERNGQIFRASVCFKGAVWRDWAMVDWADWGVLPNKLWGFVDLTGLPQNSGISFGGLDDLSPGLYAIVENASYGEEEDDTDLTRRIFVECDQTEGAVVHNYVYYLADVEAFVAPCMVIPNIGGPSNSYIMVKEMAEWRTVFEEWLSRPHSEDVISDQEGGNSDDEESVDSVEDEEEEVDDEAEAVAEGDENAPSGSESDVSENENSDDSSSSS